MRRRALLPALALALAACGEHPEVLAPNAQVSSDLSASVIYSNFGPGMSFDADPYHGWSIYGFLPPPTTGQQAISDRFTPSADYRFRDAQVPLVLFSAASRIRVLLQADADGLPGQVIEEMSVTAPGSTPVIITASSALFPMLREGTPYWLTLMPESGVLAGWNWNSIGDISSAPVLTMATTQTGDPAGPWIAVPLKRPAFQIDGTPVTPQDAIQFLIADIRTLVSEGALNAGEGNGLIAKLAAAIPSLNRGSSKVGLNRGGTRAACNQLHAFVNQVNGLVGTHKLPVATGQQLVDAAESIQSQIGCVGSTVWPVRTVTLDAVTLTSGTVLQIGGLGTTFNSTITNHTTTSSGGVRVVTTIRQGSVWRGAGDALVACGAQPGVLPVGTCVRVGDAIVARNTGSGSGTLVAGAAEAVIEVRDAASVLDSVLVAIELTPPATSTVMTGIRDIRAFLDECPTDDPAYDQIRQDFQIRVDGQPDPVSIVCSGSYASLPLDQLTDELIVMQVLRTAYYMSKGTEGRLPWTQLGFYEWMKSHVGGVNLRTTVSGTSCCQTYDGRNYFNWPRQNADTRGLRRTWSGIAPLVAVYAHEIRHADPGAPGHTNGCPDFPLPTDSYGCDATYDLSNLGSYGIQYWFYSGWATGYLNIGIACSPSTAQEYATTMASSANGYLGRFVTNPPPLVTATEPYGGLCVMLLSTVSGG